MSTTRSLGPLQVNAIGLGCMNLSHGYGPAPPAGPSATMLLAALEEGVNFLDTAALYGFGFNESLIGHVLSIRRRQYLLASKCGMQGVDADGSGKPVRVIDGRPETLRQTCEDSLRRLRTDHIDLYYLHRWDKKVPLEDSVGALADLVRTGKIRAIGLSEVSAATLRRAHAVHPIAAVQNEYSLWTRNPEIALLQTCQELGVGFVAFSPLARGFLTSQAPDPEKLHATDLRHRMPRFSAAHYPANLALRPAYLEIAREADCTPSQLALAWLLQRAPHIVPIPGTTRIPHMKENMGALNVRLDPALAQRLDNLINQSTVSGQRYDEQASSEVDTENF